jgi:pyruvate formate lyase activating enzyme
MKITAFNRETLLDYPGKIACEVFTHGCNYKCPSCHAKRVINGNENIPVEEILKYIKERKDWIDGIVVCGGEPTMQADLPEFLKKIKDIGISVKLDTNGSNPVMLEKILHEELADYVAMDIKGSPELYPVLAGTNSAGNVETSMIMIPAYLEGYEFRTTAVPLVEDGKMRWLTKEDMDNMTFWIYDKTGSNRHKHYLQKFVAREKDEMLDERFCKENLAEEFRETPARVMNELYEVVKMHLSNARLR